MFVDDDCGNRSEAKNIHKHEYSARRIGWVLSGTQPRQLMIYETAGTGCVTARRHVGCRCVHSYHVRIMAHGAGPKTDVTAMTTWRLRPVPAS